jgi:hypothetical protein
MRPIRHLQADFKVKGQLSLDLHTVDEDERFSMLKHATAPRGAALAILLVVENDGI